MELAVAVYLPYMRWAAMRSEFKPVETTLDRLISFGCGVVLVFWIAAFVMFIRWWWD